MTDYCLALCILLLLLLIPALHAFNQKKDLLSIHNILGWIPQGGEAKMGAPLIGILLEAASGAWSLTSHTPKALTRDTRNWHPKVIHPTVVTILPYA